MNSHRQNLALSAVRLGKAFSRERLCLELLRGALFIEDEEDEGHNGALLNHYQTATRATAALKHTAAASRACTAHTHPPHMGHPAPTATRPPRTQPSVEALAHVCATTTH